MCRNFWDVRAFGAVMTTGVNCGQVRGPVQLTFARSIGPILSLEHAITRKSVTTEDEAEKQIKKDGSITGTMGRKMTVPYGLYRCHGFVSAHLARDTGFTDVDLALLWQALVRMFEEDRSATRGQMSARGLYVFKHASALGNAPSHRLQATVKVTRNPGVVRSFTDFVVTPPMATANLPSGVELLTFDCDTFGVEPLDRPGPDMRSTWLHPLCPSVGRRRSRDDLGSATLQLLPAPVRPDPPRSGVGREPLHPPRPAHPRAGGRARRRDGLRRADRARPAAVVGPARADRQSGRGRVPQQCAIAGRIQARAAPPEPPR